MIKIPFCKPFLNDDEVSKAIASIQGGWITTGKVTEEAERAIAEYLGAKHAVLVTSCTAALHLSLEYLKTKMKVLDSVCVPSLTFAATATEVVNSGLKPVFGEVNEQMLLQPTNKIDFQAIIPVHLTGIKAKTDYTCPVIEDSAHLFEKNQMVGNKNLACFSFYATKNLTMGEGGAIATNDTEAYEWFRKARHHGISKDGWKRYEEGGSWRYDIEFIGWKYNPSDVLASILLAQLGKIEQIKRERQRVVDLYNLFLKKNHQGLHLYPVLVKDQDAFIKAMAEAGIQTSVHFQPLHLMTAFKDFEKDNLINTEYLGSHLVSLPLYPMLTNHECETICQTAIKTNLLV